MTNKQLIVKWVRNIPMYEKNYDVLNMLLNNTNDRFFVRIMTELAKGNLELSDFETILGGPGYDDVLLEQFKRRDAIRADLELLLNANDAFNVYDEDLITSINENLFVNSNETNIVEEVKDEEIYNFFKNNPASSLLYRKHMNILLKQFNTRIIDRNFLNRYIGVPVIPINYNNIILTKEDKQSALRKGITIDEVKKLKSLSYYYRVRGD